MVGHRLFVYQRGQRWSELVTVVAYSVGSRRTRNPRSVVLRRPDVESALAEVNSFLSECQQFGNIAESRITG